jgi:hypothetical protein
MAGFLKVVEDYSRSRDVPKARKPADGEPSETEPVPHERLNAGSVIIHAREEVVKG